MKRHPTPLLQTLPWLLLAISNSASSLSFQSSLADAPWMQIFSGGNNNGGSSSRRVVELKDLLSAECSRSIGMDDKETRARVEEIIAEMAPLNPTPQTARSPLLKKKWILEWTSEKEINFFLQKKISNRITQTLTDEGVLENDIPFVKGGRFGVTGDISPASLTEEDSTSAAGLRTEFKFRNAELDLGRWGSYNFPPIGEGWFDTVFLDEEWRIDTNSRDDILICSAEK